MLRGTLSCSSSEAASVPEDFSFIYLLSDCPRPAIACNKSTSGDFRVRQATDEIVDWIYQLMYLVRRIDSPDSVLAAFYHASRIEVSI